MALMSCHVVSKSKLRNCCIRCGDIAGAHPELAVVIETPKAKLCVARLTAAISDLFPVAFRRRKHPRTTKCDATRLNNAHLFHKPIGKNYSKKRFTFRAKAQARLCARCPFPFGSPPALLAALLA